MKTTHFFLLSLVVGLMSLAPAEEWAAEATDVAVSLDQSRTGGGPDISLLPRIVGEMEIFKGCKLAPHSGLEDKGDKAWYVLNIPLKINARGRDKESGKRVPAHYIDELNLEVYLLVTKPSKSTGKNGGKGSKGSGKASASPASGYYMLKKEIVLQDIPMEKAPAKNDDGKEVSKADVPVGIFFPRSTVYKLTGKFGDPDAITRPGVIAGYAVLATFKGQDCRGVATKESSSTTPGETRCSKIFNKKLAQDVGAARWWKERSKDNFEEPGYPVMCISETPYANYYLPMYPRCKPVFGAPVSASSSAASGDSSEGDSQSSSNSGSGSSTSSTSSSPSGTEN